MPSEPDTTAANGWICMAPVSAPENAVCSQCCMPVVGTDYRWRGHFPLLSDFRIEYAHPECVYGEGTKIVQELQI